MSLQHAYSDAQERAPRQKKDRATRRSVERRSLLVELADPPKIPNVQPKLTMAQARAALFLSSDLQANWPTSGAVVMSYGEVRGGNGDAKLVGVRKDHEAARRVEDLKQFLQPAQRELLGIVEAHNFASKATLATLPVNTGYTNSEAHKANVEGRIAVMLDAVGMFYASRIRQFLRPG